MYARVHMNEAGVKLTPPASSPPKLDRDPHKDRHRDRPPCCLGHFLVLILQFGSKQQAVLPCQALPYTNFGFVHTLLLMQVLGASDSLTGKAIQHRLEVKGSIPPWVLDRLTGVIRDAHPAKFQVHNCVHDNCSCSTFHMLACCCPCRTSVHVACLCSWS